MTPELRIGLPNQHIITQRSPANQVKEAQGVDVEAQCHMYVTVLPLNTGISTIMAMKFN